MTSPSEFAGGALPVARGREIWREVWRTSRGHRGRLAAVAVVGALSAAAGLVAPAAIGWLVDEVQTGTAGVETVVWATAIMAVAAVAGAIGTAITIVLAARSYQAMLAELRERLVERALNVPQRIVERAGTGDLISRSSDDVAQIADAAPQVIPALSTASFSIVVTFAGMAALDWWYGAAFVLVVPVYVVAMRWYLATAPRIYRAERAAMSERAQQILESQHGYATVLGFGLGEQRHRRVLESSWAVVAHTLRARTVQNMLFGRMNLAECLGLAAILVTGFLLIGAGQSTVGVATAAMLLLVRLLAPVNELLFVVDVLQSAIASLGRIVGVVTMPVSGRAEYEGDGAADGDGGADGGDPDQTRGTDAVRLHHVEFRYDADRPALDDVTLRIVAGERVAIVGSSGAGKTTLASIIAGIHEPHAGVVSRPRRTAVITQESHVFACTLRENLTLAAAHASDEEVHLALRATGAAGLLDLLPEGLDTRVGAGGHALTAAQAQQISLARIVLADPELAILDEATAEAGSVHAELLDRAADAALRGRTGLVIAHRLSQAATCDRILVMHRGRIIEDGTHPALVAAGGTYARLWTAWNDAAREQGAAGDDPAPA